jgi:hypothetical protein
LAAAVAAQRSGQTAALHAPEAVAEEVAAVAQPDAVAAPQSEEVRVVVVAVVVEEAAQQVAAAVGPPPAGAPGGRAHPRAARPSAAGLSCRLPAARLAPSTRVRSAHVTEGLPSAAP